MSKIRVGLFNDSFPPTIDGVAQTVKNYAAIMQKNHCDVTVVTPEYKHIVDNYPFEVVRYPSVRLDRRIGYRAGFPFSPDTLLKLHSKHMDIMHVHSPFASSVLVSNVNHYPRVPVVLTYHTKFDVDIHDRILFPPARKVAMKFLLDNVNAADEIWVVTKKCGEALRDIGYKGGYTVMENGTDFSYGRAPQEDIDALREKYNLKPSELVFLFVGRMMWCKNIRLILDSLKILQKQGVSFRMLFVGDGFDAPAIKKYAFECGLAKRTIFTGTIQDRERLRVFYSTADLFLFPSTYDTCGIVVKEAAACDCPSLLIKDSCAAEGAIDGFSGILAEENAASCSRALLKAGANRDFLREVGKNAGKHLYLSWDEAVARAYHRYEEILKTPLDELPYNARHPVTR